MILVISQSDYETSTEEVMDWLEHLGCPVFRLNGQDLDSRGRVRIEISDAGVDFRILVDEVEVPFSQVKAVWYRRWLRERRHEKTRVTRFDLEGEHDIKKHLTLESRRLSAFLFSLLSGLFYLGSPDASQVNKLSVLGEAARLGFDVPVSLVANRREDVVQFARKNGAIITKPIGEAGMFLDSQYAYFTYTAILSADDISSLPDYFFPSLFQKYEDKEFELRVFYLEGECDAMAIFSQRDSQTKVDFRRYNHETPSRTVPYQLSKQTCRRIKSLMDELELVSGSLDLIKTNDGREVFLEVNPVGQFGMVSKPCNYHLERKIAYALQRRIDSKEVSGK